MEIRPFAPDDETAVIDLWEQCQGLGRAIMAEAENRLAAAGCPKINLQVRTDNLIAIKFYRSLGYNTDAVVSLGKRLVNDNGDDGREA